MRALLIAAVLLAATGSVADEAPSIRWVRDPGDSDYPKLSHRVTYADGGGFNLATPLGTSIERLPPSVTHYYDLGMRTRAWRTDPGPEVNALPWRAIYGESALDGGSAGIATDFTSWGCYQPAPDQVAVAIESETKLIVPLKGGMASMTWARCKAFVELALRLPP